MPFGITLLILLLTQIHFPITFSHSNLVVLELYGSMNSALFTIRRPVHFISHLDDYIQRKVHGNHPVTLANIDVRAK